MTDQVPEMERLRIARLRAGYPNRAQVVELLGDGFSKASIHRWENGEVAIPFDKILKMAELYNVSLDWLAGRTSCDQVHKIDHGKLLVDKQGFDRVQALRPGDSLPPDVISPRFNCVVPIPTGGFIVLTNEAMERVQNLLTTAVQQLKHKKGKAMP